MNPQKSRIRVEVQTQYIEHQSAPDEDKYLFSYTITIINLGDEAATLKSRHWVITDGNGQQSEVQAPVSSVKPRGSSPILPTNTAAVQCWKRRWALWKAVT